MKKIAAYILTIVFCITLAPSFFAEPVEKSKAEIVAEFKNSIQIGTWIPYILTEDGAKTMKENGIDFIFLWWYDNLDSALPLCEKYDIKCIIDAGIRADTPIENVEAIMQNNKYFSSPAVIGYYLIDEPSADKFDFLGNVVKKARQVQPALIPYVNLFPEYATQDQLGTKTFAEYMRLFTEKVDVDYISTDVYPYNSVDLQQPTSLKYLTSLATTNNECIATGREHWLHIQSLGFGGNRSPSAEDMTAQLYISLSFGATKLMHFCYAIPHPGLTDLTGDFFGASVTYNGEKTEVWNYTKAMNDELKLISPVLQNYKNLGAFTVYPSVGRQPLYVTNLPTSMQYAGQGEFKTLQSERSTIVGCFEAKSGDGKAFTIVNSSELTYKQTSEVTFSFNTPKLVTAYPDGVKTVLEPDENGVYTLQLGIGDGVLIETSDLSFSRGDVNSDGSVSLLDAMLSFMHVAGKTALSYPCRAAADLDGNGTADIADAMRLFMFIAGKTDL